MRCRPFPGTDIKASETGFGTCTLLSYKDTMEGVST